MPEIKGDEAKWIDECLDWLYEHEGDWKRTEEGIVPLNGKYIPPKVLEFGKRIPLKENSISDK